MPSNRLPQSYVLINVAAVGAAPLSQWVEMSGFQNCSYTVRLVNTLAITGGQLVIRGTNYVPQDATSPAVIGFTAGDAAGSGGAYTLSASTGVLAVAPGAGGTFIASFNTFAFPKFLAAEWLGGTGGGTVSLNVTLSGW